MAQCPKCMAEVETGKRFCPECGEPISRKEPPTAVLRKSEDRFEEIINSTGRYKVRKLLGRGGMGVVYLAYDKELGIEVAIKSLPPELSSDVRSLNQLRQEAKLSMQLTHQGIVRLYDLKEVEDSRLLVMEYVPGFNLSDYLFYREKLLEEEAWEILKPVASALDYAHSQKVIHRDIKPSNILFKTRMSLEEVAEYYQKEKRFPPELEIKVADFGIARTVSDSMSRLSNIPVSGTLTYMSSEQIRGKRQTSATDVYSLGVVAYELLCGHPPFYQGEITYQIINEPPEPIPGVKPEYMQAILMALAKNPEDRPQSCAEFIELPKKLSEGKKQWELVPKAQKGEAEKPAIPFEPSEKREPISAPVITPKAIKAKTKLWLWGLLGILFLSGLIGVGGYFRFKQTRTQDKENLAEPTQTQPSESSTNLSKPSKTKPPPSPRITEPSPKLSKIQLLWAVGKNQPNLAHKGRVNTIVINQAQSLVASGSEDGFIKLWNLPTGGLVRSLPAHLRAITSLAFSPNGEILASGSKDSKVKLWDPRTGNLLRTIDAGIGEISAITFNKDGSLLASASAGTIKIWKVPSGELEKKLGTPLLGVTTLLAWSTKGELASTGMGYVIKFWNLETGKELFSLKGPTGFRVNSLEFSPGGSWLVSAGSDKNLRIWKVSEQKLLRVLSGHTSSVNAVAFNKTGETLISAGADDMIKIWRTSDGVLLESIPANPIFAISFIGSYLATGGCPEAEGSSCETGEIRLYRVY